MVRCRAAIDSVRPDLRGQAATRLSDGWDSIALDVGGVIFKFPHDDAGRARLRAEPAAIALLRPRTALQLPQMRLHERPTLFSEHEMVPGVKVTPELYSAMAAEERDRLACALATFYLGAHAVPVALARAQGADSVRRWPDRAALLAAVSADLDNAERAMAEHLTGEYVAFGADERVFGHFDTHGWNMAYDPHEGRLTGLYDFAGAGIGALHRDLSYPTFVDPDLTRRVIVAYNAASGRNVDLQRALAAHGMLRVVELAEAEGERDEFVARLRQWAARRGAADGKRADSAG